MQIVRLVPLHFESVDEKPTTIVRVLGVAAAPFVMIWDGSKALILGFFGLADKLDPMVPLQRLVKWLAPAAIRIREWIDSLFRPIWRAVAAVLRLPAKWLSPIARRVEVFVRSLSAKVRQIVSSVRDATEPVRRKAATAAARVRAVARRVLTPAQRAVQWVRDAGNSLGRQARRIIRR